MCDPSRSADGAVCPGTRLSIEGRDLLVALKRFAASLVHSPNSQQRERQLPGNSDPLKGVSSRCGSDPAVNSDDLDVVEPDISGDVHPLELGRDKHMWKSRVLGLIVPGMC